MRWVSLTLVLVGCAGLERPVMDPPHVTECGMIAYDGDPVTLDRHEFDILKWSYAPEEHCSALKGWRIYVNTHPDENGCWVDQWGRAVCGLTYCELRVMEIGTTDWPKSALAHEVYHAFDCPYENGTHAGWEKDPEGGLSIYDRINRARTGD